jgi:hypothetical protein
MTKSIVVILALGLVACQAASSGQPGSQTPSATGTASMAPGGEPTATPKPLTMPRPTDVPVDGSCEEGHVCLGVLTPGQAYTTTDFVPHITFSVPEAGWENLADGQGAFQLLPIATPGDAIAFFRAPKASGAGAGSAGSTVEDLVAWLVANPLLEVTAPQAVTVGGASGVSMDIRIAADAENQDPACPVQVCVTLMKGLDPSPPVEWDWDWGSAGTETQRLFLVTSNDGVVAIFVDSLDGMTFDVLTAKAGVILGTLKFG